MGTREERTVIPVVQEEVSIGKERHDTATVRVEKTVEVENREVEIPLHSESVEVRREARNEILEKPMQQWQEGDTLVIPVMEERLVVEKKLVLTELVYVTRRETTQTARETVELRRESVKVDRTK
jgi:uncharacterized protein (TIGR02271 family)